MERSSPGGATGSQTGARSKVRIKQENDGDSNATHSHTVYVRFSPRDKNKFTRTCTQPRTVLELLKLSGKYDRTWSDENIVIQMGRADKECIIATHFPCTCINEGELLTLSYEKLKVEARGQNEQPILSRDRYSVFYIETEGGINTTTKKLFKNNAAIKKFKFVVVYGEKGMTVKEAVERDGRFIDDLGDFTLSHNENPDCHTDCTEPVDSDTLDGKKFKLCLEREKGNTIPPPAVVHQIGISVTTAMKKPDGTVDVEEIYEKLRKQFPDLKEWMESRFPGDSYQKALNLKSKDFGKIQQSFSEVHRVRDILELGKSVCKVIVEDYSEGTGFVLFDNYILTNAHLFKGCTEGQTLKQGVNVSVLFNYEKPEPFPKYHVFQVAGSFICFVEDELDYAALELNPEEITEYKGIKKTKVPPGLLNKFGPIPQNGEACIIGHPGGQVKQMDPICIIEKENRGQAVAGHVESYRDTLVTIQLVHHLIKEQGIDQIMMGGKRAENVSTYNTYMYHGSSGSPVFDAHGRVFGLHTRGYVYDFPKKGSVIELAQTLLTIFEHFVKVLKKDNQLDLLKRVEKEANGNSDLEKIFESVVGKKVEPDVPEEILGSIESMKIG